MKAARDFLAGRLPGESEYWLMTEQDMPTALLVPAKAAQERRGLTPVSALFASSPAGAGGLRVRGFAHECAIAFEERIDSERKANPTEQ